MKIWSKEGVTMVSKSKQILKLALPLILQQLRSGESQGVCYRAVCSRR